MKNVIVLQIHKSVTKKGFQRSTQSVKKKKISKSSNKPVRRPTGQLTGFGGPIVT